MSQRICEKIDGIDQLNIEDYTLIELIASSQNAIFCYENVHDQKKIAVKEINYKLEEEAYLIERMKQLQKIKDANHPNIIEIYGISKIKKQKMFGEDLSIIIGMELAEGNLEDYIQMKSIRQENFEIEEIQRFIVDIVGGLYFLQDELQIAHCDIKPQNILIVNNTFKLGDLDFSKSYNNKTYNKSLCIGTLAYSAPELLRGFLKMKEQLVYNTYKADVFSFGLCLLYMASFRKFSGLERKELSKFEFEEEVKMIRKKIKSKYSRNISKLIKLCLVSDSFIRVDFVGLYSRLKDIKYVQREAIYKVYPSIVKELQRMTPDQLSFKDQTTNNNSIFMARQEGSQDYMSNTQHTISDYNEDRSFQDGNVTRNAQDYTTRNGSQLSMVCSFRKTYQESEEKYQEKVNSFKILQQSRKLTPGINHSLSSSTISKQDTGQSKASSSQDTNIILTNQNPLLETKISNTSSIDIKRKLLDEEIQDDEIPERKLSCKQKVVILSIFIIVIIIIITVLVLEL